jgi:hypothetical protein
MALKMIYIVVYIKAKLPTDLWRHFNAGDGKGKENG